MSPEAASDPSSLVGIAVANGFALTVAVYISVGVSGGHVNPAVTFARAVGRHISVSMAIFYWISQLLGSIMACVLLKQFTLQQVFILQQILVVNIADDDEILAVNNYNS